MERFYVEKIPKTMTISSYIEQNSNLTNFMYNMKPKIYKNEVIKKNIDLKIFLKLVDSVRLALDKYGEHGFYPSDGGEIRSKDYTGLSITYNPERVDNLTPIHASSFRQPSKKIEIFEGDSGKILWVQLVKLGLLPIVRESYRHGNYDKVVGIFREHGLLTKQVKSQLDLKINNGSEQISWKSSYSDSMGFNVLTPAAHTGFLHNFLQGFNRSLVRSRIAILNSSYFNFENIDKFWHRDENIFHSIRWNIPIVTSKDFMLEIEGLKAFNLQTQSLYSWNTELPHRIFPMNNKKFKRIHLVLGFSPWFDFELETNSFIKNKFYGKVHPLDMLVLGHFDWRDRG